MWSQWLPSVSCAQVTAANRHKPCSPRIKRAFVTEADGKAQSTKYFWPHTTKNLFVCHASSLVPGCTKSES